MFLMIVLNHRTLNDRINMMCSLIACVESIERKIRNDCRLETSKLVNGAVLIATEEMIGKLNESY